ncbi:MAG: hypothetical protein JJU36_13055 [Phycisphaeraceae bacterium]|nr:hypothetical protein [Phycisphaeraceae bacterium]
MRIVTVTSDNFLDSTCLLLESLRLWHREPVAVYALEQDWTEAHSARLEPFNVELHMVAEPDKRHRQGGAGRPFHALWKLDVFLAQDQPFVYLDADTLVLRSLDHVFERTARDGWFTVLEGTRVAHYNQGPIAEVTGIGPEAEQVRSFNTGVLGCDPARHRDVFAQAREWGHGVRVSGVYFGDQGLMNLAWYRLHGGTMPPDGGEAYNTGLAPGGRIKLHSAVLHFAGPHFMATKKSKAQCARDVWAAWPHGVKLVDLTETEFWRRSQPHPWAYINQVSLPRFRSKVNELRKQSHELIGTEYLLVPSADHAWLLDSEVLKETCAFWREAAGRFAELSYLPTYHLAEGGRPVSSAVHRWDRFKRTIRSCLPW